MLTRRAAHLLLAAAALSAAPVLAQNDPIPPSDVPALKAALYDANARPEQREQAAQRLLARPDPSARDLIRGALVDHGLPAVQLAVAKALANRPVADPTLKQPLFDLLEKDNAPWNAKELIDAAARALTAFKADPDTLTRLLGLSTTGDERVRTAAIHAAGTYVEKRAADGLVALTDVTSQPYAVATAASEAMAYLTGQPVSTNWRAWWDANKAKTDAQFQADLARERSARYDLARTRVNELEEEFYRTLNDLYQKTPRDARTDLLVRYMRSPESSVRSAACRIAQSPAANEGTLPQPVKEQLRQLVGDASPEVRRNAALILALINDSDALVPLLTQLNQETDPGVKAAIADALKPIRDSRAVPALLALLDDPVADVSAAAAEALVEVGQRVRQADPAAAERIAEKLVKTLQTRTTAQNGIDLRNSLVQALAPLQSRSAIALLLRMLDSPAEDYRVRRSLLETVGNYHDPEFANAIARWIDYKNDPGTRLAAVRALGESANNFGDYEKLLASRLDPGEDKNVQDAAWRVLVKLMPTATTQQLGNWENRLRNDFPRLLVVLREERDRAQRAGDLKLVADKNQQIADVLIDPRNPQPQYREAINDYLAALDFATKNNRPINVEFISPNLVRAYLLDRQFQKAIDFTQQQIKQDPKFQDILGPEIRKGAERLALEQKDFDSANQLMDMALKMDPALSRGSIEIIKQLQAQVRTRNTQQNQGPLLPGETIQTAMR